MTQVAPAADPGSFLSALQSARAGMLRGLRGLASHAQAIAHANVAVDGKDPADDLTRPLVAALQDRVLVQLSARVMRAADETLGTIIDVKA